MVPQDDMNRTRKRSTQLIEKVESCGLRFNAHLFSRVQNISQTNDSIDLLSFGYCESFDDTF